MSSPKSEPQSQSYHKRYYYRGSRTKTVICSNCSGRGHLFKDCKKPIQSYGVLAWTRFPGSNEPVICMIQRRHTISFEAFIRGKYNHDELELHRTRMTRDEKRDIREKDWESLYDQVMNSKIAAASSQSQMETGSPSSPPIGSGIGYCNQRERERAKRLYQAINIQSFFAETKDDIVEPTWEFPKGRKYLQEEEEICALREFNEETGVPLSDVQIVRDFDGDSIWFEEKFCGINKRQYCNRYLLATVDPSGRGPFVDPSNESQLSEVQNAKWFTLSDALSTIHWFHPEKIACLNESYNQIKKFL